MLDDIESVKLKEELINLYIKIKISKETDVKKFILFYNSIITIGRYNNTKKRNR